MSLDNRREDLLVAVALTEFSVHYEAADPELSQEAWQLAASRLVDHDVGPDETVDVLDQEPHEILDVTPHAPEENITAAFRAQIKDLERHPDTGGTSGRFQKLKTAHDELLRNHGQ